MQSEQHTRHRHVQMVINEISDAAPTALQAVKLLALYLSGKQSAVRVC